MDKEKLQLIERKLKANAMKVGSLEQAALEVLEEWLGKFDKKDGRIVHSESTKQLISSAIKAAEKSILNPQYQGIVSGLIADFDEVLSNLEGIHSSLNDITFSKRFIQQRLNPAKAFAINETITALSQTAISANVLAPIKKVLVESVQYGYTLKDAQRTLQDRLKVSDYIGQISRDSLYQFDGTVNNIVLDEYGLDAIRYTGTTVTDTRGQCKKWEEMENIAVSDLASEIAWAKRSGSYGGRQKSGMIPQTNERNFTVYRGGYNCRHRAFPTRLG